MVKVTKQLQADVDVISPRGLSVNLMFSLRFAASSLLLSDPICRYFFTFGFDVKLQLISPKHEPLIAHKLVPPAVRHQIISLLDSYWHMAAITLMLILIHPT